ncbi:MAG: hypothetical protein HY774_04280 [Acidobacteria bacterium]|nr:hypothetical protein [Acidobacteriota bacterium]
MLLVSRKTIRETAHWLARESFRFQAVTDLVKDESVMGSEDPALSSSPGLEPTSGFDDWLESFQMTHDGKCAAVTECGLQDDAEVSQQGASTQK